jgi:hypothetical protein
LWQKIGTRTDPNNNYILRLYLKANFNGGEIKFSRSTRKAELAVFITSHYSTVLAATCPLSMMLTLVHVRRSVLTHFTTLNRAQKTTATSAIEYNAFRNIFPKVNNYYTWTVFGLPRKSHA